MDSKLHILQHSLGLDEYGEGRQYRNHFVTGPGSDDWGHCVSLVGDGLMTQQRGNALTGGDDCFRVTPKGIDYVALNSPARPKLTRSQQRYREFLDADCGLSFREWLGARS
jgi:hypothetical protein